jgi:hypothetical protein
LLDRELAVSDVTEIPVWDSSLGPLLDRESLVDALASYLRQVNARGYEPDSSIFLVVRREGRSTALAVPSIPKKDEIYFRVEGEVFLRGHLSRLLPGEDLRAKAEFLAQEFAERLSIWASYDFAHKSSEGFRRPFDPPHPLSSSSEIPSPSGPQELYHPDPVSQYLPEPSPKSELPLEEVGRFIDSVVEADFRNRLPEQPSWPIFERPILGIADAMDPVFLRFQRPEVVGAMHRLPREWLAGARSVLCLFFPFGAEIADSYSRDSPYSSLEFSSAKYNGSKFLNVARRALIGFFEERGGRAVAPSIDPRYGAVAMRPFWSERHAAFAAGLGTFGLHQGLITERGVFGRLASVVTSLGLAPTLRPYQEVHGYCPFYSAGSCGLCIGRCPTGAISPFGKVPGLCLKNGNGQRWAAEGYGACGHCSTFLPCSRRKPG